jgi:hypothetical protein
MNRPLSPRQTDLLRALSRLPAPAAPDGLDGRVLRALVARGCVEAGERGVSLTPHGRPLASEPPGPPASRPRRSVGAAAVTRARAVWRAADRLDAAIPAGAEVAVGRIFACADDVVRGFRLHALRLEGGRGAARSRLTPRPPSTP